MGLDNQGYEFCPRCGRGTGIVTSDPELCAPCLGGGVGFRVGDILLRDYDGCRYVAIGLDRVVSTLENDEYEYLLGQESQTPNKSSAVGNRLLPRRKSRRTE